MTSPIALGTVAARNHLPRARVLAESLREHHPDLPFHLLLTDLTPQDFDSAREALEVIAYPALLSEEPRLRRHAFACDVMGLASSCKPLVLEAMLDRGHERVLFVDADCLVTGRLDPVLRALDEHSILLSPHRLAPPAAAGGPELDLRLLQCGTFNAGLIGLRDSAEARAFLAWWRGRMEMRCRHALEAGLFYDQRWLDLVPGMFDGVGILRAPEINVAWWNVDEREIVCRPSPDGLELAGCALIHFSGFPGDGPGSFSRYSSGLEPPRATAEALSVLARAYGERLDAHGETTVADEAYGFAHFEDGTPIPAIVREIYADLGADAERFGDPFRTSHPESFFEWLRAPVRDRAGRSLGLSNLWLAIHRRRPDLQACYPDPLAADQPGFIGWIEGSGIREHAIPEPLAVVPPRDPPPRSGLRRWLAAIASSR